MTSTATTTSTPATSTPATSTPATSTPAATPADGWVDPRTQIEVGVLLADGRLAGRRFASRAEAEAFARPEDGEQVVEFNLVCECAV